MLSNLLRLLLVCVALLSNAPAFALDKIVFGEQAAMTAVVSSVGLAKGFFKNEGIDLQRVFTTRGNEAIEAALAGKMDFSYAANSTFLAAVSKGAPLVAVGLFSHGYSGFLVASNSNANLRSLAEFRGKRIGMQRGTGVTSVFLMALKQSGLKESDFQISNLRVADMPSAMQGGTFDAVIGWEPSMSRIVAAGYGKIVMTAEQIEKIAGVTYTYPLFTTKEIVKQKPDLVQRFMKAWVRSQRFTWEHHAEALQILRDTLGDAVKSTSAAEMEQLTYVYKYDRVAFTDADLKDLERMQEFMLQSGMISSSVPIASVVDNSFASRVAAQPAGKP
jgi:aliphatic sulfonates family ABC transporter substrate-binding protein